MGKKKDQKPAPILEFSLLKMGEEIEELKEKQLEVAEMAARFILKALDKKDNYTFEHSARVSFYGGLVASELGVSSKEKREIELTGLFHDIGKIGIPDEVLLKPARLSEPEFQIMKLHPVHSEEMLRQFQPFENIALFVRHHHERWDGRGYPDGLKEGEIPLPSRITLIADTFDAMTSSRNYRKALPYEVAFEELEEFSGSQFDPFLVKHFIRALEKEKKINRDTFEINFLTHKFKKQAA